MKRFYVGVDLGFDGGIVVLDENARIMHKQIMPTMSCGNVRSYDIKYIAQTFVDLKHESKKVKALLYVTVEEIGVMPINGKRAHYLNGFGMGMMGAILTTLKIPHQFVKPQIWMKHIFEGMPKEKHKMSVRFCEQRYPEEDWTKSDRASKVHDGMTDATCIALYGQRYMK